ncbi:MAG: MerR family transcriptional regulator [Pseudolabrys sp.]
MRADALDEKSPEAFRTISEVAVELDLPQHVLRFWESRFREIKPMKRGGGRRYYRPDDVTLLRGIKHLLYGEGYTIRGVQRILREQGVRFVQAVWQEGAPQPPHGVSEDEDFVEEADSAAEMLEEESGIGGRLTSLIGRDFSDRAEPIDARQEPPMEGAPVPRIEPDDRIAHAPPPAARSEASAPPARAPAGLAREDLRKLQAALHELVECRKLIEAAAAPRAG